MPVVWISSDNYLRESCALYSPEKNAQPSVAVLPRVNEQADHQKTERLLTLSFALPCFESSPRTIDWEQSIRLEQAF